MGKGHTQNITSGITNYPGPPSAIIYHITTKECGKKLLWSFLTHPPFVVNTSCKFFTDFLFPFSNSCSLLMPFLHPVSVPLSKVWLGITRSTTTVVIHHPKVIDILTTTIIPKLNSRSSRLFTSY